LSAGHGLWFPVLIAERDRTAIAVYAGVHIPARSGSTVPGLSIVEEFADDAREDAGTGSISGFTIPRPSVLGWPGSDPLAVDPHAAVGGLVEAFEEVLDLRLHLLVSHRRQWRKLSPSAERMVDPGSAARCAIRDDGRAGVDRRSSADGACENMVMVPGFARGGELMRGRVPAALES
jgi:hypothetical protein